MRKSRKRRDSLGQAAEKPQLKKGKGEGIPPRVLLGDERK